MILDELVRATRDNMLKRQLDVSLSDLKAKAGQMPVQINFPFEEALHQPKISVIAEIKQASPSKGQIIPVNQFDYMSIARQYEAARVDLVSVLTEETYFKGSLDILKSVVKSIDNPVLRKDFTIDPYMIYEAKVAGTSAVLLIVAILDDVQLSQYLHLADQLGLSAIVEAHTASEIKRAIAAKARIIGINNRNLKDFTVDFKNTARLRALIPEDVSTVSESGIQTREDVALLEAIGVNGILVGEAFMKAKDKIDMFKILTGGNDD
ncbi:indole-3-glycerol phosphate synthase TrpC [Leuconostoc rapi]|uniref:indole-3-glycerol phosphate synthase TrpC n=1 Tax=Leuconostoc rapi TaxID=1406906 RepID=UPI00195DCF35|nr:indole-3-glycerol phosphate synthase TrpC [Leuconostoc rapi]MBM7435011.1 indole-3-glycerol phosphate synthase [Leuconostoc rapi]